MTNCAKLAALLKEPRSKQLVTVDLEGLSNLPGLRFGREENRVPGD